MDRLIEVMFKNVSRSAIIITGIYLPGFLTLFIRKYDMFKELDVIKLSILSLIIASPSFVVLFGVFTLMYSIFAVIIKKDPKNYLTDISIYTVICNILVFALYLWNERVADSYFLKEIIGYTIAVGSSFLIWFLIEKVAGKVANGLFNTKKIEYHDNEAVNPVSYDVKKRMRYLKQMYIKTIPEEYSHDGNKRYKTECARYEAVYDEILKCNKRERDNLEILLKCDKTNFEKCSAVSGLVSIFLTVTLAMIALLNPFVEKILTLPDKNHVIELLGFVLNLLMVVGFYAIILYVVPSLAFNYFISRSTYFLEILEKIKCSEENSSIKESLEQGS
jgi:hypothetical protein